MRACPNFLPQLCALARLTESTAWALAIAVFKQGDETVGPHLLLSRPFSTVNDTESATSMRRPATGKARQRVSGSRVNMLQWPMLGQCCHHLVHNKSHAPLEQD